jgi:hypothetical protein
MTSPKQHLLDSPIVHHHTSNLDTPKSSSNVQVDSPTASIPRDSPIEFPSIVEDTTIVSPPPSTVADALPHEPRRSQRQQNAPTSTMKPFSNPTGNCFKRVQQKKFVH